MKRWIAVVLLSVLALWQAPAQARLFSQAELDALLAPIALYPDAVVSHVLVAATLPDEVREAAAWSRANPQLAGEDAVRAAEPTPWHPSVKALLAFPDLLARMEESPQWLADLGHAFREQEPYVMDTVQALRRRAQTSGMAAPSEQHWVPYGESFAIYPAHPNVVYLPYYDPYVVYGPWWWPSYRPVYWRPWHPRPAFFANVHFFRGKVDWHRRHVVRHHVHHHRHPHAPVHRAPVTVHHHAHHARAPAHAHRGGVHREHRAAQVHPRPIVGSTPKILPHPGTVNGKGHHHGHDRGHGHHHGHRGHSQHRRG